MSKYIEVSTVVDGMTIQRCGMTINNTPLRLERERIKPHVIEVLEADRLVRVVSVPDAPPKKTAPAKAPPKDKTEVNTDGNS